MSFLKNLAKAISPASSPIINNLSGISNFVTHATQAVGNFYGFDNSGHFTNKQGMFHMYDEGIGELTGRNQSRKAMNVARDQYNYARQQSDNLIAQQRWDRMQTDIASSQGAQAITATNQARGGINEGNTTPMGMGSGYQSQQKDFLGL